MRTMDTADEVSGLTLREAMIAGFDAALAEAARVPMGCVTEIEERLWCRGYDALTCEPIWLESNR